MYVQIKTVYYYAVVQYYHNIEKMLFKLYNLCNEQCLSITMFIMFDFS